MMGFTRGEWVRATLGAIGATVLVWAGVCLYILALS